MDTDSRTFKDHVCFQGFSRNWKSRKKFKNFQGLSRTCKSADHTKTLSHRVQWLWYQTDTRGLPRPSDITLQICWNPIRFSKTSQRERKNFFQGLLRTCSYLDSRTTRLTSMLSQPIISPYETWWQRQYVGSLGSTGMSSTSEWLATSEYEGLNSAAATAAFSSDLTQTTRFQQR